MNNLEQEEKSKHWAKFLHEEQIRRMYDLKAEVERKEHEVNFAIGYSEL